MRGACNHKGWLTPTPDSIARDREGTLWCAKCGHSWDGSDAEILQALTEEIESDAARSAPHPGTQR